MVLPHQAPFIHDKYHISDPKAANLTPYQHNKSKGVTERLSMKWHKWYLWHTHTHTACKFLQNSLYVTLLLSLTSSNSQSLTYIYPQSFFQSLLCQCIVMFPLSFWSSFFPSYTTLWHPLEPLYKLPNVSCSWNVSIHPRFFYSPPSNTPFQAPIFFIIKFRNFSSFILLLSPNIDFLWE